MRSYLLFGFIAGLAAACVLGIEYYQPERRFFLFASLPAVILILFNIQALAVAPGPATRKFSPAKAGLAVLGFVLLSVLCCTPVQDLSTYIYGKPHPFHNLHWLTVSLAGSVFSLAFVNFALRRPRPLRGAAIEICLRFWRMETAGFLAVLCLWFFAVAVSINYFAFEQIPHVSDSISQLFQARIFSRGSLTAPLPPIRGFFQYRYDNIVMTDRWYSQYPFAHSLLLTAGLLVKAPWIVNPLLGALCVVLLYKCTALYCNRSIARLAAILYCVSPFVAFMSASYMNHVSSLFFLLMFLYCLLKTSKTGSGLQAFIAGTSFGLLMNTRPGEAFCFGLIFGTAFFLLCVLKKRLRPLVCFGFSALMMLGLLLAYNQATTGDPFVFGYQVRWGKEHTVGFSDQRIMESPPHTPRRGLIHSLSNATALNQNLFEWPVPCLLPLMLLFTPFLINKTRRDWLMLLGAIAAPVFYFFYFYQDLCLGPRFYYLSLPFVLALTSLAIFRLMDALALLKQCPRERVRSAFAALLLLFTLFAFSARIPQLFRFYSDSFWFVDNRLMLEAKAMGIENAVIFQTCEDPVGKNLMSGFLHNSPWLDSSIVFARDLGERNAELIPFFPGRKFYISTMDKAARRVIIKPLIIP